MATSNREQREFWDGRADLWERRADLQTAAGTDDPFGERAMERLALRPGHRVLDVGCGPGLTTFEIARRVAPGGEAVGLDISPAMVAAATRRAGRESNAGNVRFVAADAQSDPLESGFDAVFSRFGVMFFSDPDVAFANLRTALLAGGRLACAVWGPTAANPWMSVPTGAAAPVLGVELEGPPAGAPGPFAFADTTRLTRILADAGFIEVRAEPVESSRPVSAAAPERDIALLLEASPAGNAWAEADGDTRQRAVDAVMAAIEPYRAGDGWRLPSLAFVVSAAVENGE